MPKYAHAIGKGKIAFFILVNTSHVSTTATRSITMPHTSGEIPNPLQLILTSHRVMFATVAINSQPEYKPNVTGNKNLL
jgi:hypothetical protein